MNFISKYKIYLNYLILIYFFLMVTFYLSIATSEDTDAVIINADEINLEKNEEEIKASGNIRIETKDFLSSSDKTTYNKKTDQLSSSGNVIIKDKLNNHYYFDSLISDKDFNTAIGSNVRMRMSDGVRIVGTNFTRKNGKINQINNASYTPCLQKNYIFKNCPGWQLNAKKVIHDAEKKSVYYEGATLRILNLPVLYTPFFSHPDPTVKKRSGFLMPEISSDNTLGTSLSIPLFYNISSNFDATLTPTIQTKADDYFTLNYRHLTKNHEINIESSISYDESNTGTKNHFFLDGNVENPYGKFNYRIRTSNNDTYLRKNQINDLTVLSSGLNFTKEMSNGFLDFSSYVYKHLNNSSNQKWEYVYPNINYDIYKYEDPIMKQNWEINNSFLNYRDINKNYNQQIASEFLNKKINISKDIGLKFENTIQSRFIYFNSGKNNFNQVRVFPQLSSKISYPLIKNKNNITQLLEPIIMPIVAPYNNYPNDQSISNSNIFSLNRETSLSQWESGPRLNYGVNWLISYDNLIVNSTLGQSAKIEKNDSAQKNEVSNYFITNTIDFGNIGYIKTDFTLDRKDIYLKDNNINASVEVGRYRFGFDYDYETSNKIKTSEQISMGTRIKFLKDTSLIASLRKNLMTQKSIGNAFGLHYENDCLAMNFDYFRDFTAVGDIKNSHGFSFTITLKPFGTSKQSGKTRNFGPEL